MGDAFLEVLDIRDAKTTSLKAGNNIFTINDLERQEVLPSVFVLVSLGWSEGKKHAKNFTRLAIEAPRELRIERVPDAMPSLAKAGS
ncbi:hypothetical protein AWV79_24310 [Cupriavidus sp. UYMMa02A]|nr:hypothetical protein AWV79_24310 [Cupriavidus sp. UYMMa02A]